MKNLFLLIVLFLSYSLSKAQLEMDINSSITPVMDVKVHKGKLFVATQSGLKISLDDGKTYYNAPLPNYYVNAITTNEDNIVIGTYEVNSFGGFIYRSTDAGLSWQGINGFIPKYNILALHLFGDILFASMANAGIYRSTNYGETWTLVNNGITELWNNAINSNNGYVYVGGPQGVYMSADSGLTWTPSNEGLKEYGDVIEISDFAFDGDTVFAGATTWGVFRSTNNGLNWVKISHPNYNDGAISVAVYNHTVYAGIGDKGVSFYNGDPLNWPKVINFPVTSFNMDGGKMYFGTNHGGVYMSDDLGTSCKGIYYGTLMNSHINFTKKIDEFVYAGNYYSNIFRSSDDGTTWSVINIPTYPINVVGITKCNDRLFVADQNGKVVYSENNGISWNTTPAGIPSTQLKDIVSCGQVLYVSTANNGVYSSTDFGNSWQDVSSGLPGLSNITLGVTDNLLLAGTPGGVFYKVDNTFGWTFYDQIPNKLAGLIKTNGNNIAISVLDTWASKLWISTNKGNDWTQVNEGYYWNDGYTDFDFDGSNIFVLVGGGKLMISEDLGHSWSNLTYGLVSNKLLNFVKSGDDLLIGTSYHGLWKLPINTLVKVEDSNNSTPNNFILNQNYPNPFNPSTIISFSIPEQQYVTLKVYDILGKEVITLISEELTPGNYTKQWNAFNFSSGVYFYTLQAGNNVLSNKMLLIK